MIRNLRSSFLAMTLLAMPNALPAEQAPRSQQELERGSDLIIEADVLWVAKCGQADAPVWRACLGVRKTLKGTVSGTRFCYSFLPPTLGEIGGRNESVFAGSCVVLYLVREQGEYRAWASNSIQEVEGQMSPCRILPTRLGEVIMAPVDCR